MDIKQKKALSMAGLLPLAAVTIYALTAATGAVACSNNECAYGTGCYSTGACAVNGCSDNKQQLCTSSSGSGGKWGACGAGC